MSKRVFLPGDPIPWFVCRSTNNPAFHFDTAAGRYLVLSFFGSAANEKSAAILNYVCTKLRPLFNDDNIAFFGVSIDPVDEREKRVTQMEPGIRYFWDFDGAVSDLYGAIDTAELPLLDPSSFRSFTLVIDPCLRVMTRISMDDPAQHNQALAVYLLALPPAGNLPAHAPVLILPHVL